MIGHHRDEYLHSVAGTGEIGCSNGRDFLGATTDVGRQRKANSKRFGVVLKYLRHWIEGITEWVSVISGGMARCLDGSGKFLD